MKWRILLALVALYFHLTTQDGNKAGIDDHNIGSDTYSTAAGSRTRTSTRPDTSMSSNNSNICITGKSGINCNPTKPEVTTTTTGPNRVTVNEVRKIT